MRMTDEQRYSAVLKELGEVLASKNTTISCQQWQVDELKGKLAAAEKERDENLHEYLKADKLIAGVADAAEQLRSINKAIRKCVNMESKTVVDWDGLLELQEYIKTAVKVLEIGGAA